MQNIFAYSGDIATSDGMAIEEEILKGKYLSCRARKIEWPYQQNPKTTDWSIRRKGIKKGLLNNTGKLQEYLGK